MFEPLAKIWEKNQKSQSMLFPCCTASTGQISALVNLFWRAVVSANCVFLTNKGRKRKKMRYKTKKNLWDGVGLRVPGVIADPLCETKVPSFAS